jgi:ATP-binding cassette subfamily F protein 3
MLLTPFNVLIMDEPTNHLDMLSKQVLKKALIDFGGSLIVVSHDRDFLQGLVEKVYEFREHQIKEYLGDIDYYLEQRKFENFREVEKKNLELNTKNTSQKMSREQEKAKKRIKNKIGKLEIEIGALEKEVLNLDAAIFENDQSIVGKPDFFENYQAKKDTLDALIEQWSELQEQLEN